MDRSIVLFALALLVGAGGTARADRVVRNADGSIRVRVERNADAASPRAKAAAGAADATAALLANWGVADPAAELRERLRGTDRHGRTHIRYRQVYRGLEVDGRELVVHEKDCAVYEANGEFLAGLG